MKAIVLHRRDNVATSLKDLSAGEEGTAKRGEEEIRFKVVDEVPFGHKFALVQIDSGMDVVKYGRAIGKTTATIGCGRHVHVHNVATKQGEG